MGNRAIVLFHSKGEQVSPCIYLHWNGGAESIYTFVKIVRDRYERAHDVRAITARFIQTVGEFFDSEETGPKRSGCSLYVWGKGPRRITLSEMKAIDPDDNGVYAIDVSDYSVRRFIGWGETFAELSAEEVRAEKAAAETSDYTQTIPASLERYAPPRTEPARLAA